MSETLNFIEQIVATDVAAGNSRVQTRFPPEPNGYIHIGHAKAICMDFGVAEKFGGVCNLRFDDTNPSREDTEYVEAILQDIKWLGFQWKHIYYASDYFDKLYALAVEFIKAGKAYVDEQSSEVIASQKGTPTEPGVPSPFRDRPIEENLALFEKMRAGEVSEGAMVLRAKIDMGNANMHFRDPIIYRIITSHPHHRTGRKWNIYPMYDFAHGESDYFEGVTHSICTLEFVVHRPLYDYFLNQFVPQGASRPHQYEFNRLNITYTVMSKRKLLQLVQEHLVNGWDDPRMPTVCGLRRRGYTPTAIRSFIEKIGYTKVEGTIELGLLEHTIREELKPTAPRVCAIFDPVKLVIKDYPDGELYIEREDFREVGDKDFYRLSPDGMEVRLKNAYIIRATGCEKDAGGVVTTVFATYDPTSLSGTEGGNRKTKSTINWVACDSCLEAEVRLYDRLFTVPDPSVEEDFKSVLNPESLVTTTVLVEGSLADKRRPLRKDSNGVYEQLHYQFLKKGFFVLDPDTTTDKLVFNRVVTLKE